MKILLNPDDGAEIKNYNPGGGSLFTEDSFKAGTIFQFEDDTIADKFKENFGFLEEITPEDAKKFMGMERLNCDLCDFSTRTKAEMERHKGQHAKERELSDLGIPVIKKAGSNEITQTQSGQDIQQASIDAEDSRDGLEGIGLQDDRPIKSVVMS